MTDPRPGLDQLLQLMARLRAPDGCPWDRDQYPGSLTPYILEEACELIEAIREDDPTHVCEELGDLLFQIVFQAQIGAEQNHFTLDDVIAMIHEKMTRRHPHVFGDVQVENSDDVRQNWVRIKEQEGRTNDAGALGKVPRSLPALLRGRRYTENAAQVGFDWPGLADVWDKVEEEMNELEQSMEQGDPAAIEDEFGDLLFALVNLSRFLKLDPEQALHRAVDKFKRRFQYMEQTLHDQGRALEQTSLEEMDRYWDEAKENGV